MVEVTVSEEIPEEITPEETTAEVVSEETETDETEEGEDVPEWAARIQEAVILLLEIVRRAETLSQETRDNQQSLFSTLTQTLESQGTMITRLVESSIPQVSNPDPAPAVETLETASVSVDDPLEAKTAEPQKPRRKVRIL